MGATYTRQSNFTDGDVITADLFNNEFDQLLAAYASSTGHTHDGTAAEGGPISKLLADTITIGTAAGDISLVFDGGSNDGTLKWMEDEDYFEFSDDVLIATNEKIQFRDTAIFINSSADGQLDIVADTEIQIAATTIDINGAADISGNLAVGGNLTVTGDATVTGTTTFNGGTLTLGDAVTDNVVFGADVNSSIIPNGVNGSFDLGSSSQEWRDLFINGTAHIDTLDVDVNATVAGTLTVGGVVDITDATDASDATGDTGALRTEGGASIAKKLFVGTTLDVTGVATVGGLTIGSAVITEAELEILDGANVTTAELNILDGVTSTAAELNILDGVTSTTAELNILDGVTSTAAELNILDVSNSTIGDLTEISTAANDDVFLALDTSGGGLKKITRSTILAGSGSSSDIANVVEDTSPQLGGNLDMNGADIVTTSNATLDLAPNGTGTVVVRGNTNSAAIVFNCESNSHGQKVFGQPHSASVTNTLMLPAGANSTLVSLVSEDTLTNKTLTSPKINENVAVTSTATELNLLDGVTSTTAELNILDGVTSTAAEINLIDGGTARGTTAVADGDGFLTNDGGTMRMTKVDTLSTYMSGKSVGGSNMVTTGALNAGSITSGFGTIDTGASAITTTGLISGGSLDIDNVLINGTTIGHTDDTDLMTLADGLLTVAGEVQMTTLDIGGTNVTSTAAELNILDGVTSTAAELNLVDGAGTLKEVGKETIWVPSAAMYPSTTNPCSDLTQVETTALRPDLKVLDFATGADEFAQFAVAFPKSWNEGTVTFQPFWTVTGTNTGTVAWQLGGIAVSSDDTINTAFGSLVATTALAHSGTSNDLMVSVESGAVTIAGSPAANDMCFFQINRDVSADAQSGDARLLGIKLFFTTDAANDA